MNVVEGNEVACVEGCRNNPLTLAQVLYLDEGGEGRFDLVIGKGHDPTVIDALEGPCLVAGHCAIEEVGARLAGERAAGAVPILQVHMTMSVRPAAAGSSELTHARRQAARGTDGPMGGCTAISSRIEPATGQAAGSLTGHVWRSLGRRSGDMPWQSPST